MPEGLASCWGMVNDESKQTQVGLSCRLPRHTVRKAEVILDRCIDSVPFYAYPAPLVAEAEAPERLEQPLTSTLQAVESRPTRLPRRDVHRTVFCTYKS